MRDRGRSRASRRVGCSVKCWQLHSVDGRAFTYDLGRAEASLVDPRAGYVYDSREHAMSSQLAAEALTGADLDPREVTL